MFTTIDKALAALIGGILTIVATFGIDVAWATPEIIATFGAVLTAVFTWLVPNKAA